MSEGVGELVLVGDLHGRVARLERYIERYGEDADYLFLGDFFDRGTEFPDGGYRIVRRILALPNARALVGNHEALILSAVHEESHGPSQWAKARGWASAKVCWERNGGREAEFEALKDDDEALAWLRSLDFMTMVEGSLVQHADTPNYLEFGDTVDQVNEELRNTLSANPWLVFARLTNRRGFVESSSDARAYLDRFGATRLIHAHTPHWLDRPFEYHDGLCIDLDGKYHEDGAVLALAATA